MRIDQSSHTDAHRDSISNDAVPVLVAAGTLPISAVEAAIVAQFDGLRTVTDVALAAGASLSSVRALILQLAFYGAVVLDEWMQVDDLDILDERCATLPPEPVEPEAILLKRRRKAPKVLRVADDSPLIAAVLAALAALEPQTSRE